MFVDAAKQDPIVAEAQAELGAWGLELDDVTGTSVEIAIDGQQYVPSGLSVDRAQISAGRGRPDHNPPGHSTIPGRRLRLARQAKLLQDILVRNALTTANRRVRLI